MSVEFKQRDGGRILEVRVSGKMTASDYKQFVPEFERLVKAYGRLRVLVDFHDFHGWTPSGFWEDIKFDARYFADIERLAIIGETGWQKGMAWFCEPFTKARIRYFTPDQADAARQWLSFEQDQTVAVAVFDSHRQAEAAVKTFEKAGFDMKTLSIVGQDYQTEEQVIGYYDTGARIKAWGKLGAFWGGICGLRFGRSFFANPEVGPGLTASPWVATVVAAVEGAVVVGGMSALGAALYSVGIPRNSLIKYQTHLRAGKYLLLMTAKMQEIEKAENEILKYNPPEEFALHAARHHSAPEKSHQPAAASVPWLPQLVEPNA
jgi:hypothetical protein